MKGLYENHMLNGSYEVYFGDSTLMMSGQYLDDNSTGTWSYYDETGELLYSLDYKDGYPVDYERYLQLLQDTLRYDTIQPLHPFQ